jgi:hypothetical protein
MMNVEDPKVMHSPSLSPFATPYHPESTAIDIAIYNDGVPSMMLVSEADVYSVLQGIEDILESFPLDAADAAELDAVDAFVECMAMLAYMEEREERCRNEFVHIKMRWEARRAKGLVGRPHPAPVVVRDSGSRHASSCITTALVRSGWPSHHEVSRELAQHMVGTVRDVPRMHMKNPTRRFNIHQPRKQN